MNAIFTAPHPGWPPDIPFPALCERDVRVLAATPPRAAPRADTGRIVSIHFPMLATDRSWRGRLGAAWRVEKEAERAPLVHAHRERSAMRIAHLDERAAALGLRVGQGLADAKAIHPDIDIVPADEAADRRLLSAIADWCDRYTPLVALDAPDGLFLDISGCAHLFGGERALIADLLDRFYRQGFAATAAVASTAGAAWAAARFHGAPGLVMEGGVEGHVLRPFGVASLRLDAEMVAALEKVGLKTVGHLMDAPRAPLTRRFGRLPLMRLDQALGQLNEALSPRLPVPALSVERRLAEPVGLIEDIEHLLHALARSLKEDLERRGVGARAMEFTLFRVDGAVTRLCVGASRPVRDPETIVKLFRERIKSTGDELDAGYGFDVLRLNVLSDAPFDAVQADMNGAGHDDSDVAALCDRIAARLGKDAGQPVRMPHPRGSHVPERAEIWRDATQPEPRASDGPILHSPRAPRPVRLFDPAELVDVVAEVPEGPPVRFRWRRALYEVTKAEGPERIGGEWWLDDAPENLSPVPRDYYRVEDRSGRRFWLYRSGLYGAYPGDAAPRWFMHGLFA